MQIEMKVVPHDKPVYPADMDWQPAMDSRPCPFCLHEEIDAECVCLEDIKGVQGYTKYQGRIACVNCGASVPGDMEFEFGDAMDNALAHWNTREWRDYE